MARKVCAFGGGVPNALANGGAGVLHGHAPMVPHAPRGDAGRPPSECGAVAAWTRRRCESRTSVIGWKGQLREECAMSYPDGPYDPQRPVEPVPPQFYPGDPQAYPPDPL